MKYNAKLFVGTILMLGIIIFSAFAFTPSEVEPQKGSLKVLSKDISHDDLMAVMKGFVKALNFKCSDCHAKSKTNPGKLDFASDEHPHKEITRNMMRMTMKINKKYFDVKGDFTQNYVNNNFKVSCFSCHHGDEHPATVAPVPTATY
jgi:hypothetical protein